MPDQGGDAARGNGINNCAEVAMVTQEENKIDFTQFAPKRNLSIPNFISLLRLAMIPLFIVLYLRGHSQWAAAVVIFSAFTDVLDGYIARHYDQVTELGKVLDPMADKLTQISLAVFLCSSFRALIPLMVILLLKELTMLLLGLRMLKAGLPPVSARWWGKLSTALFYAGVVIIMAFNNRIGAGEVLLISVIISVTMLFSLLRYGLLFSSYVKEGVI